MVKAYPTQVETFAQFLEQVKNDKGLEGCVLRYEKIINDDFSYSIIRFIHFRDKRFNFVLVIF